MNSMIPIVKWPQMRAHTMIDVLPLDLMPVEGKKKKKLIDNVGPYI